MEKERYNKQSFSQGSVKGTGGKFKHAKQRVIGDVTEDILPFYMSPEESLELYIRSSVNAIEKARFLGKNIKNLRDPTTWNM